MKIKFIKQASGKTENFGNIGLENHIYYNKNSGLVFCKHETQNTYTLFTNGSIYIMKSKKHITMNGIRKAIEERMNRQ